MGDRATARSATAGTTLVLIGDPKQAIYAFRGADVYAYLDGRRERRRAGDARRQPAQRPAAARRPRRAVRPRPARPPRDRVPAGAGGARPPSAAAARRPERGGAASAAARPLTSPRCVRTASGFPNAESARAFVARDLAADVVGAAQLGSARSSGATTTATRRSTAHRSPPADVAVLVRTHRNARADPGRARRRSACRP